MDRFRTAVNISDPSFRISYHTPCLLMGSCFTDSIGERMIKYKYPARYNPFGVLYNPASIAGSLRTLMGDRVFTVDDLRQHNGLWISLDHHSSFDHKDRGKGLSEINRSLLSARTFLKQSRYLFLTFGTAWTYIDKKTGNIAANCHKIPSTAFERKLLEPEEIVSDYRLLITELQQYCPGLKIIFTVSPIRHMKDGAFNNQVSKSILLLSVFKLQKLYEHIHYFPAYEIFFDELRDYRFYADDMLHPSESGISYIWERFCTTYFDEESKKTMAGVEKILKAINHRPFQAESAGYKSFVENTIRQMEKLQSNFPFLNFSAERKKLSLL